MGPLIAMDSVWQSDKILKNSDEHGKEQWKCLHCNGVWKGHNHTKALNHLLGHGKDIKLCSGTITLDYMALYQAIFDKKE